MTDSRTMPAEPSYYESIGGAPTVREAVDRLYKLIFDDDQLAPYFDGTDVPSLKAHMAALLTKVLGGPDGYTGRDLHAAHQGLGVTDEHFHKVGEYMEDVLVSMGASGEVVAAVGTTLAAVKGQIVTTQSN